MELEVQSSKQASPEEAFAAAILPAERAVSDLLTGPARVRCQTAFEIDAEAFEVLVAKFVERAKAGRARTLGLLLTLVQQEHAAVRERLAEGSSPVGPRRCASCGVGGGLHIADCENATTPATA